MNTADFLLERGRPDDVALLIGREATTYGQLKAACARVAGELVSLGVRAGDRVAILAPNSLFWVAAYLATLKLDAVAVPLATLLTPTDLGDMERTASCRALCVDRHLWRRLGEGFRPELARVFDDAVKQPGPSIWPACDQTDLSQDVALMFTSGTTARPRAVRVTHRNLQANTESIISYLGLTSEARMMVVLPFHYCFGASLLHTHLRVGASLVLCNTFSYPETALDCLEATACTGLAGVPTTFQILLRNSTFPKRKLETLRQVQQAGGKLSPVLIQELVETVPQAAVYVMYGQTEATARMSYLPPEYLASKLGSIGRGIPGVELRVVDAQGADVLPGQVGEVVACGASISPGYLNDCEATQERFVDGALHTGDLATVDEEGFIYIVDRATDFIKTCGYRVSSQRIESCVLELPEVVAAAAIGEPDLAKGEAIVVFVVLRAGASLDPEAVIAHCGQNLAHHMVPARVEIIDRLPTNAHGKVVKAELRARLDHSAVLSALSVDRHVCVES